MNAIMEVFTATVASQTYAPPRGFKWVVHGAYGSLVTGTAAGTRRLLAQRIVSGASPFGAGTAAAKADIIFDTGTSTLASSTIPASLTETDNSVATTKNIANVPLTISCLDQILVTPTLVGADAYTVVLSVEVLEA